ncbi:MAG TPA: hypothetical protein VJ696_03060 [Rhodanobacteraceae bacterium]|nr:hypothetical protein [Rhodanobacteraceae bacterium]
MIRLPVAIAAMVLAANAFADTTLAYRSEGGCAGDFERLELKAQQLRVDSGRDGGGGSMIYDHVEKLAYFVDHRERQFMQTEMDEDAVDLQADVMKSLRIRMRRESGADPFELAKSLCPGFDPSDRDRLPEDGLGCGAPAMDAAHGGDARPIARDGMGAMMQSSGIDAETLQKMMEQALENLPPEQRAAMQRQLAAGGMPGLGGSGAQSMPAPQRIDRDAGEIDVDGIRCLRREHLRGDAMLREDCYAAPAALGLADAETRRIARFSQSIRAWSRSFAPDDAHKADDRVLVRRICYAGARESGRATLAIDHAPIAPARFEVPAGYRPMDPGLGTSPRRD